MAAEHERDEHRGAEHSRSLPEAEQRERDEEAAADGGADEPGRTPSLAETERRAREREARDD